MTWAALRADRFEDLDAQEFEEFAFELCCFEAYDRHQDPSAFAPTGEYRADGGRDFSIEIRHPPTLPKLRYQQKYHLAPLTEDQGTIAYSCKTGDSWWSNAKRDAKKDSSLKRVVHVLASGGYFKLLTNVLTPPLDSPKQEDGKSATLHRHLCRWLQGRVHGLNPAAGDISDRVEIIGPDRLANFCRQRNPSGSLMRFRAKLGIALRVGLLTLDEWDRFHDVDRGKLQFEWDETRRRLSRDIDVVLGTAESAAGDPVLWLTGPPGIGKSRLLLETLRINQTLAQRTVVAETSQRAREYLAEAEALPTFVLVVDDCPADEIRDLVSTFRARAGGADARLVLITPGKAPAEPPSGIRHMYVVERLDDRALGDLIGRALGSTSDDSTVRSIVRNSNGYVWFAKLLAEEARLSERGPRTMLEAVDWALASGNESSVVQARDERGRALVAIALSSNLDWMGMGSDLQDELARAVRLPGWEVLYARAQECDSRGLVRRQLGWQFKYVTPRVLEQELIKRFFGPNGSDPGARRLNRDSERFGRRLTDLLLSLDLDSETLRDMAKPIVQDLQGAVHDLAVFDAVLGSSEARLMLAATSLPAQTSEAIRQYAELHSLEELRAAVGPRRKLVWALESLVSRQEGFEAAEAALFRLALAENEEVSNNATGVWQSIFTVELNATHRSLSARFDILERHLQASDAKSRALAVKAVGALLRPETSRSVGRRWDGDWPRATTSEAASIRESAWLTVLERLSDADQDVAAIARQVIVDTLGVVLESGAPASIQRLAEHVDRFSETERTMLRHEITLARIYRAQFLQRVMPSVEVLEHALHPTSYSERLHQQLSWTIETQPDAEANAIRAVDEALAREGLTMGADFLEQLSWLKRDEAARAAEFAMALGSVDEFLDAERALRSLGDTRRARLVYAYYVKGEIEGGRGAKIAGLIEQLRLNPSETARVAYVFAVIQSPRDEVVWLTQKVKSGDIDALTMRDLARLPWLRQAPDDIFVALVDALACQTQAEYAAAALEVLSSRLRSKQVPVETATVRAIVQAVAQLPPDGLLDYLWAKAASELITCGETEFVAPLAIELLERQGHVAYAWSTLHQCFRADALASWSAIAAALESAPEYGPKFLVAFKYHSQSFPWPVPEVLEWVGKDARRARLVADLVRPHETALPGVLRELIIRFGPSSSVAEVIAARVQSTEGGVASLAAHDERELERARRWAEDPNEDVQRFSEQLIETLESRRRLHSAEEDYRRRRAMS